MPKPPQRPGSMPAEATSFVGRRHELAEARKQLAAARLVSMVGPGGVGKTRLAVHIAASLARGFPDGAWLAELAELQDPGLVGNAVMTALDLRDQTAAEPHALLLSYLRDKELLLVLDNGLGVGCYRLHETMRESARLKLHKVAEEAALGPSKFKYRIQVRTAAQPRCRGRGSRSASLEPLGIIADGTG